MEKSTINNSFKLSAFSGKLKRMEMQQKKSKSTIGQSLIETLVGIGIATIFITGAIGIMMVSLRISNQNQNSQPAIELANGLLDQVSAFAQANWHNVYDAAPHSPSSMFHLVDSGSFFAIASGSQEVSLTNQTYTKYFSIEDVYRDGDGAIAVSGTLDPSTLKITATVTWQQGGETANVSTIKYIARNKSQVFRQTDWTGGPGDDGPHTVPSAGFSSSSNITYAVAGKLTINNLSASSSTSTTNIDSTDKWAWNDVIGWIDFGTTNTVVVSSTQLLGYASSGVGYIAFDCGTAPTPDCTYPYGVVNDGNGNLSGWAWNDTIGWISFSSSSIESTYGVTIDVDGNFGGWAWNDTIGWISFSCDNTSTCGTSSYKVKTLWSTTVVSAVLTSSIFETQVVGGAAFNSLLWQGTQPAGTNVKFQIATSNSSSGPWTYVGPDNSGNTYYQPAGPNIQIRTNRTNHDNNRYIRYRVYLESNIEKTLSPEVDDIIVSWSP